ncbi:MAG: HAMP domain-containing sensor histidine kinase [Geothrix sp.]|nr:HAMP domain-containing sensor histidine kinase [Geothrix sp.]
MFAPQGRATPTEVGDQASLCLDDPVIHAVLDAVDSYAMILNPQRQILAANPAFLEALSHEVPANCRGLRLGEALGCVHAGEGSDGCGTSRACGRCGSLLSILATQGTGQPTGGECLISLRRDGRWEAREFVARARPLTVAGHRLTLLTLQDISAQKRRETLERIFIHDLTDSLRSLQGWTEALKGAGADATTLAERILDMAGHLAAEVEWQRRLLRAERGELTPDLRQVSPDGILDDLMGSVGVESAARLIRLPTDPAAPLVRTDPAILCGILTHMVLNALEAVPSGGQAWIWHESRAGHPTFVVQNPGCMAPEVADRIFQRSFTTKAPRGRGLGTYGMKVMGETVLGGKVGFTTGWEEGTRFFITLPESP